MDSVKPRLEYIDYLRVYAIGFLLIFFHVLCGFTALIPWWYVSTPITSKWLDGLIVFLDMWGVASLFYISGLFVGPALAKKGAAAFFRSRVVKLFLPSLLILLLLCPVLPFIAKLSRGVSVSLLQEYELVWRAVISGGVEQCRLDEEKCHFHLWFVEWLLVLNLIAVVVWNLLRPLQKMAPLLRRKSSQIILISLLSCVAATAMGALLLNFKFDAWYRVHSFLVVQPVRLPLYSLFFLLGVLSERMEWHREFGRWQGIWPWLLSALICVFVAIELAYVRADWRPFVQDGFFRVAVTLIMLMLHLWFFAHYFPRSNRFVKWLANASLGVYLLHLPVVAGLLWLMQESALLWWVKALLITAATSFICFILVAVFQQLRGVSATNLGFLQSLE